MATFGQRLKQLRMEKKLTQKQMCEILGITDTAYQNYEYDKREMNITTLRKLADFFDVSVDYLIGRTNYWVDSEGNIKTKVPPDILDMDDMKELKKRIGKE